jgi:hypothetical protein
MSAIQDAECSIGAEFDHNLVVVIKLEAELLNNYTVVVTYLSGAYGSGRSCIYMTLSKIYEENGEKGVGMSLSKIVIEAEELSDSEIMLCLRVDTHLIAKNLTTAQMKFLVGEILDRIAVSDVEKEPESIERQLH